MNDLIQHQIKEILQRLEKVEGRLNSLTPKGTHRSILDLKDIIAAKEKLATEIRDRHAHETALGPSWDSMLKKLEWLKLKREIRELNKQIADL